jgi:hypothetical protein
MKLILAFLIGFAGGWSLMACDALFRTEDRPGIFRGTVGMVFLLVLSAVGGLALAGDMIWAFQSILSSGVLVLLIGGMVLGFGASKHFHVNAAGAVNRMLLGFATLLALYALVWTYFRPVPPGPPPVLTKTAPTSK